MNCSEKYYQKRLTELENTETILKRRIRLFGLIRLLVFLALFPSIFFLVPMVFWAGIVLSVLILSGFLLLVKVHIKQGNRLRHIQALISVNRQEMAALHYNYRQFYPGNEFIDTMHPYSFDMDLFGEGSLYQFINRTATLKGRELLAGLFSKATLDTDAIYRRQEAVRELAEMMELTQNFRAAGMVNNESETDLQILDAWIHESPFYLERHRWLWIVRFLPFITIVSLGLAIFLPFFRGIFIIMFLLQLLLVGTRLSHTSREHNKISKRLETLKKYQMLLEVMEKGNYKGKELLEIQTIISEGNRSAAFAIRKLTTIVAAFDNRLNVLAAIFLEGLLLWDIQCMIRLEKWKARQGRYFHAWIEAIARFDAWVSLATYALNYKNLSYPVVATGSIIEAENLGHILIPDGERVCNNFQIRNEGSFVLITGANMAGKSTFLRTVATNMILAMAGAPVCAEKFIFRPMELFSSMRTSDSLNKHESYFYAELRRLKEMLDRLQDGEKLFIILDEILKGTNSADKQKGSYAALKKILGLNGTGILATHDLDLVSIQNEFPERIKNMCFEIEIDKVEISFDYLLREGVTTKMNALLLMRQMGIIEI